MDKKDKNAPERLRPPVRFNVPKMFELAGGNGKASDMVRLLVRYHGVAPELTAVQMWATRQMIPSQWQAAVLFALLREGNRVIDLLTRDLPV